MWAGNGKEEIVATDYCYLCIHRYECKDLQRMKEWEHRKWLQIFACSNKKEKDLSG